MQSKSESKRIACSQIGRIKDFIREEKEWQDLGGYNSNASNHAVNKCIDYMEWLLRENERLQR